MPKDIDREIKRTFVRRQTVDAMKGCPVECHCGKRVPGWRAYRCYYCGEYYCEGCAAEHFGQSREEYYKEKKDKESLRNLPTT